MQVRRRMGKGKTAGELVRMLRDCVGYGLYKERWDDDEIENEFEG